MQEEEETDRRNAIKDELGDRKDALKDQYDLDTQNLDNRIQGLDLEYEAEQRIFDAKMTNANLYAQAKIILEQGVTAELIQQLRDYEDEFGEGMGILGDYVKTQLTNQILDAALALKSLAKNIEIVTNTDSPLNQITTALNDNLETLTKEQLNVIEQMKQNSIAWANTTSEMGRSRLAAENERIGYAQGWFKDSSTGTWYLDESKTDKLYEVMTNVQNTQTSQIDKLMEKYDEEYAKYEEVQKKKMEATSKANNEIVKSNNDLYDVLISNMNRFIDNFDAMANQIATIVNQLMGRLSVVTELSNSSSNVSVPSVGDDPIIPVTRFSTGGLNKEAGIRFLDPNEQVLTAEQTKAFQELVFGLGTTGMQNITNTLQKPDINAQNRSLIEASFVFQGSITQEAMPQVKKMVNDAIYGLKAEIPSIVASNQMDGLRRMGFNH
jgi:hypothetical protein